MACTIAFFILWYLEYQRTTLVESYWLALAALACLMGYQYVRMSSPSGGKKSSTSGKVQNQQSVTPSSSKKKK